MQTLVVIWRWRAEKQCSAIGERTEDMRLSTARLSDKLTLSRCTTRCKSLTSFLSVGRSVAEWRGSELPQWLITDNTDNDVISRIHLSWLVTVRYSIGRYSKTYNSYNHHQHSHHHHHHHCCWCYYHHKTATAQHSWQCGIVGNSVGVTNEVRAQLVLRWVTITRFNSQCTKTYLSVTNHPGQLSLAIPPWQAQWAPNKGQWFFVAGE